MKNLMNCPIISFALSFFMKLTYYSLPIEAIMPLKEHGSPRISIKDGIVIFILCTICAWAKNWITCIFISLAIEFALLIDDKDNLIAKY